MSDDLEERLRNHARSFDSLLSLIPAKLYYAEDVSDQWKRKKQTPEEKRAAKKAKLDPDNWKSAKDLMDERSAAAKRKRELDHEGSQDDVDESMELEQPRVIQDQENPKTKKRKLDDTSRSDQKDTPLTAEEKRQKKADKRAAKKQKIQKEKEKLERQKARKQAEKAQKEQEEDVADEDGTALAEPIDFDHEPVVDSTKDADAWSTATPSEGAPEILSPPAESGTSSISSIPPSITEQPTKSKSPQPSKSKSQSLPSKPKPSPSATTQSDQPSQPVPTPQQKPSIDHDAARLRLANAISSFRSARKADDPTPNKPRNRAELLEQRRQKEEAKRQAKKEQRRKEKEEAARKEDEDIAKRFSPGGSGSLLASPRSPPTKEVETGATSFSYGRIEFNDGSKVDTVNLGGLQDQRKKKGHQDTGTALKAAQSKASRLAGLDEQKRKDIEEKDMWLNAKRRAHGERVKDDTSLLKKALKRQEGQKKKSEKEWTDRKDGVQKSQEMKQKKRNENLAKRKEDKLAHKIGKKGKKVRKRPGFEGSFRGRTGGKKKS